jgi:plasmid stabilization system protein ParE
MPSKLPVIIEKQAQADLLAIFSYINRFNPAAARNFTDALRHKCASLASMAQRCPLAPENRDRPKSAAQLRHLVHRDYRIIFTTTKHSINILTIRHAARRPLTEIVS